VIAIEYILLITSVLLVVSVLASKASSRLGVPTLLVFLCIGMLAGSDGPGGIYFDHPWVTQSVGVTALAIILFAAGFETDWQGVRPVARSAISLATIGVAASAALLGLFVHYVLGWSILEGLLVGAIVSSTDAAAVFNVLRTSHLRLQGRQQEIIEFESGSNDPMAVLLTVTLIALIQGTAQVGVGLFASVAMQLVVGGALGFGLGHLAVQLINRSRLEWEGLYPVLNIASALLIYGLTTILQGSGFVAVYVAGIVAGNRTLLHRQTLRVFNDGLAWLMQISMFLVLGLQVYPSRMRSIAAPAIVLALVLTFVVRPLSVFIALVYARLGWRHKLMISWAGLRGAAPIVLATFPLIAGIEKADVIFHIVFFVTLISVLVQGTTIPLVARALKVQSSANEKRRFPITFNPTSVSGSSLQELEVASGAPSEGQRIVDLALPRGVLVVLLNRGDQFIVPGGSTILKAQDRALLLATPEQVEDLRPRFSAAAGAHSAEK